MTDKRQYDVFGICPICGAEGDAELDDKMYARYEELQDTEGAGVNDYMDAFQGDRRLAAFLYGGFCENHSNLE